MLNNESLNDPLHRSFNFMSSLLWINAPVVSLEGPFSVIVKSSRTFV